MGPERTDEGQPIAWRAVTADTPVYAADGTRVGKVADVVGSDQGDIFHGVVVDLDDGGREVLVASDDVAAITDVRIESRVSPDVVRSLPAFEAAESYHIGNVGILRQGGWVRD